MYVVGEVADRSNDTSRTNNRQIVLIVLYRIPGFPAPQRIFRISSVCPCGSNRSLIGFCAFKISQ
jgi:hypothetical protein